MARDVINTRVELDRETDSCIRKMSSAEMRNSKKEMATVILTRVARLFRDNPDSLKQLRILQY